MYVYIWKRRDNMTTSYHSAGGAVAVAPTVERARELLRRDADCPDLDTEPDIIYPVPETAAEFGEAFPDAGCC
jgi:hypothetical protein